MISLSDENISISVEHPKEAQPGGELVEERKTYSEDEIADRIAALLAHWNT